MRSCPPDRWQTLVQQDKRLEWKGWKNHAKKILLVVPNRKSCLYYGIDIEVWKNKTIEDIKKYSDLPIEIRYKGSRRERNNGYTIYDAFDSGTYATVTFNSIAALESVLYGIPAFVSVPCAASPLASMDLSQLANPFRPSTDLILQQCHSLAYGQFTLQEMWIMKNKQLFVSDNSLTIVNKVLAEAKKHYNKELEQKIKFIFHTDDSTSYKVVRRLANACKKSKKTRTYLTSCKFTFTNTTATAVRTAAEEYCFAACNNPLDECPSCNMFFTLTSHKDVLATLSLVFASVEKYIKIAKVIACRNFIIFDVLMFLHV